jgi:hypothetical protein
MLKVTGEKSRIRNRIRRRMYRSRSHDLYKNVTDPEHCLEVEKIQAIGQGNVLNLPRLISPATIFSKLLLSSSSYK